jgi:hypothetical protein
MVVRQVRLGDVVELQRRKVTFDAAGEFVEVGLRSFGKGIFHKPTVTGAELGNKKVYRIEPGDLVISNVFAWEGALAIASESERGLIGSHRFMTWIPRDPDQVNVRYLWHYFLSEPGLLHLRRASPGSAGRNRTLGIAAFENTKFPLPDLSEQQHIAARLDRVAKRSDDLSRFTRSGSSVLRLLPRFLDRVWASAQLPTTTVGELCQPINDLVRPGQDPSPAKEFVGLEFLQPHTGLRLGAGPVTGLSGRKFRFQEGDVLYGYLRPYQNKVWAADRAGLCSVEQYVLRPRPHVDPTLLSLALRSARVLDYAVEQTNSLQLPRLGIRALLTASVPDVRLTPPELLSRLQSTTSDCVLTASLTERRNVLSASLLTASRNEAFARLT